MVILSKYIDKYDENKFIIEYENYIHAHGGDGTLIRAVSMFRDKQKPFFGSAAGTVSFMMNPERHISKNATLVDLYNIKVEVTYIENNEIKIAEYEAFNEVAIGGDMNSWISFSFKDNFIEEFKGGGIIFSTTQGSTGLSKNNGGKVLPLSCEDWVVTGDKTNRKINSVIEPQDITMHVSSRTPITVWVDGTNNKIINNVVSVSLSKGQRVQLLFNDIDAFKRKRI